MLDRKSTLVRGRVVWLLRSVSRSGSGRSSGGSDGGSVVPRISGLLRALSGGCRSSSSHRASLVSLKGGNLLLLLIATFRFQGLFPELHELPSVLLHFRAVKEEFDEIVLCQRLDFCAGPVILIRRISERHRNVLRKRKRSLASDHWH